MFFKEGSNFVSTHVGIVDRVRYEAMPIVESARTLSLALGCYVDLLRS